MLQPPTLRASKALVVIRPLINWALRHLRMHRTKHTKAYAARRYILRVARKRVCVLNAIAEARDEDNPSAVNKHQTHMNTLFNSSRRLPFKNGHEYRAHGMPAP